jgi:hypothetical protein
MTKGFLISKRECAPEAYKEKHQDDREEEAGPIPAAFCMRLWQMRQRADLILGYQPRPLFDCRVDAHHRCEHATKANERCEKPNGDRPPERSVPEHLVSRRRRLIAGNQYHNRRNQQAVEGERGDQALLRDTIFSFDFVTEVVIRNH